MPDLKIPGSKLEAPDCFLYASAAEEVAIIVRTRHDRSFPSMTDLEAHYFKQGKQIADTIARILPAPVISVLVSRLMEIMFKGHPYLVNDDEQSKGGE